MMAKNISKSKSRIQILFFGACVDYHIKLTEFYNHFQQWCCQLTHVNENTEVRVTWKAKFNMTKSLKKMD